MQLNLRNSLYWVSVSGLKADIGKIIYGKELTWYLFILHGQLPDIINFHDQKNYSLGNIVIILLMFMFLMYESYCTFTNIKLCKTSTISFLIDSDDTD